MATRTVRYTRQTTEWADVTVEVTDDADDETIVDAARAQMDKEWPEWTPVDRCYDEYDEYELLEEEGDEATD